MTASEGCRTLGRVVATERLGSMVGLVVEIPGWRGSRAGQFALLQAERSRCFLARALSVSDEAGERVSFLIAPIGEGTRELCRQKAGDSMWVLGPLGNGFDTDALVAGSGRTVLVAGGAGVAPLPLLLSQVMERHQGLCRKEGGEQPREKTAAGWEILVLLGFRDDEQAEVSGLVHKAVLRIGEAGLRCRLELSTEDGSRGPAEKVTDLLERHLQSGDRVAVCGAPAMLQAVWSICSAVPGVETWFSLETGMACGVGSCHGCIVRLADGSQVRVCHDGPVFRGEEVYGG